jgi:hypothetical protein
MALFTTGPTQAPSILSTAVPMTATLGSTIAADVAAAKAKAAAIAAGAGPFLAQAKADLATAQAKIAASEGPVLTFVKAHYTKIVFALIGAGVLYMFTKVL